MKSIDPHFHLWDLNHIDYPWLLSPSDVGLLENYKAICQSYRMADYLKDIQKTNIVKAVHIEAAASGNESIRETSWLQSIADNPDFLGFPHGIVFWTDLSDPAVESQIAQQCQYSNVRGIRQMLNQHKNSNLNFSSVDYLKTSDWVANFGLLKKYNLSFDLQIFYHQMLEAVRLAQQNPDIPIILNHIGMPFEFETPEIAGWRTGMKLLAECSNVQVKISGFSMTNRNWTLETIRPFVLDTIDIFGPERCMFASNLPVVKLGNNHHTFWTTYQKIVDDFSEAEQNAMFYFNAEKCYRL